MKKITSFMIFVFIICISTVAGADTLITDFDWSHLEMGKAYTVSQLNIENVGFGSTSEIIINDDGGLSLGTVRGQRGGRIRFDMENAVTEGTVAFDVKLKKENSPTGYTGRNVMQFGTADKLNQMLMIYCDGSIHANIYDNITSSGNFPLTSSGRNGSYTTENEYYDLRAVFSRNSKDDDWSVMVFDKLYSQDTPFYVQTVSKDSLDNISSVAFEVYKQNPEDTESVITLKDAAFKVPLLINANLWFEDKNGKIITMLHNANTINGVINVDSRDASNKTLSAYMVLYSGGNLEKMVKKDINVKAMMDSQIFNIPFEMSDITPMSTIKLLLWDNGLTPATKSQKIEYTDNFISSGSGDSAAYLITDAANISANTLIKQNFCILSPNGENIEVESVTYYSHTGKVKIKISEENKDGIYHITGRNLVSVDGNYINIDCDVGLTRDFSSSMYVTSLTGVDLLKDGMAVTKPDEDNDYVVRLRILKQTDNADDKFIVYKASNKVISEAFEFDISAYSDSNVEILLPIKLKAGEEIWASHIKGK